MFSEWAAGWKTSLPKAILLIFWVLFWTRQAMKMFHRADTERQRLAKIQLVKPQQDGTGGRKRGAKAKSEKNE